jgi:hypothetical protein
MRFTSYFERMCYSLPIMETVGHWWNGIWGRLARLDVYLRMQKPRWEVELREGGAEGRSRRWTFDSEPEATMFVERALAAKQADWKKMTG